jgi:hypothetical protein
VTFDEKINKATKLFKYEKQLEFINPVWGLYAVAISFVLIFIGFGELSLIFSGSSIVVSIIGVIVLRIRMSMIKQAWALVDETAREIPHNNSKEELRRAQRHVDLLSTVLKSNVKI